MENKEEIKSEKLEAEDNVMNDIFDANIKTTSTLEIIKPKELSYYMPFLNQLPKDFNNYFWHKRIHMFIEVLDSFKTETNLDLMKFALITCFKRIEAFTLELVREALEENICQAFEIYIKKLKTENLLEISEIQAIVAPYVNLLNIKQHIDNSEALQKYLLEIDEFQYTIVSTFIKYYHSEIVLDLKQMNNAKFKKICVGDVRTPDSIPYIEEKHGKCEGSIRDKLNLERVGVVVGKGTSILTPFMRNTFITNIGSKSNWSNIYVSKIVLRLAIPLIDQKMMDEECEADDQDLIEMLAILNEITSNELIIERALKNVLCFLEKSEASSIEHLARFVVWLRQNGCRVAQNGDKLVLVETASKFDYYFKTNSDDLIFAIKEILNK